MTDGEDLGFQPSSYVMSTLDVEAPTASFKRILERCETLMYPKCIKAQIKRHTDAIESINLDGLDFSTEHTLQELAQAISRTRDEVYDCHNMLQDSGSVLVAAAKELKEAQEVYR
ncbi:hypothetical protein KIPB_004340, partial [Kipferlia bialata]|eukprot:g4340.t1